MNTKTLILTIMECTATTEDEVQNAKNALAMLEDMQSKRIAPFMLRRAIKKQRKLIAGLENL